MKDVSDQYQGKPPEEDYEHSPVQYFLPDQIVLHIEHPASFTQSELARVIASFLDGQSPEQPWNPQQFLRQLWWSIRQWFNRLTSGQSKTAQVKNQDGSSGAQPWKEQIEPPKKESILTFPQKENNGLVFSIVPMRLRNHVEQEELVKLFKTINDEIREKPLIADNITLKTAAPNWLMSSASHVPGTGGPGAWPVQADTPKGDSWKFDFQANAQGKGVNVAILDTMPCVHDLIEAYEHWHEHHPLIQTLLNPQGPLHVYPATYTDLLQIRDYSLLGHRYLMPDHGLFVAGIIHTIAPKAALHLYEVLNPYGVGCIETIVQGLLNVLNNPEIGRPLIINCSFMLGSPLNIDLDSAPNFPDELKVEVPDSRSNGASKPSEYQIPQYLIMSIQEIFSWLTQQEGVMVIAAAGNDRIVGGSRPAARYPAAFDGVLGVGALPLRVSNQAATYSNFSDEPSKTGYMTMGGEPGPGEGVLGVYIGEFPKTKGLEWDARRQHPGLLPQDKREVTPERIEYERNTTGWAWWAGTSFATPIISGILAAQFSQPGTSAAPSQGAAGILGVLSQNSLATGEKVIRVNQG